MSSIGEDISHFDVLIVGTGPGGLMMAAWLAKCGVKTRIVAQKRDRGLDFDIAYPVEIFTRNAGFQWTSRRFAIANAEPSRSLTHSAFETVHGKKQTICSRIVFGTQTRTESFSAALKRLWRHITSYRRLDWWTAYCTRSANELEHSSPSTSASSSRAMLLIHIGEPA
jgi:choline dehydrogenase-like flavoprotein